MTSKKIIIMCSLLLSLAGCAERNSFVALESASQAGATYGLPGNELDFDDPEVRKVLEILAPSKKTALPAEASSSTDQSNAGDDQSDDIVPEPPASISRDVAEKGIVTPTVYYFPVIEEDACSKNADMRDRKGRKLISICSKTRSLCAIQGSCAVVQDGELRSFNINGGSEKYSIFFEMTENDCKYGYGVKSSCLDPFYTVAADLNIYQPGDVIYIPSVRGLRLPDGSDHTGYFLVRDKGRAITGKGRFDFFSGYFSWQSEGNPFSKIGLANKKNKVPYYKIKGELAKKIQSLRAFPNLPSKTIDERP